MYMLPSGHTRNTYPLLKLLRHLLSSPYLSPVHVWVFYYGIVSCQLLRLLQGPTPIMGATLVTVEYSKILMTKAVECVLWICGTIKAGISDTSVTLFLIVKCNRTHRGKLCMGPQSALVSRMGTAWEETFNLRTL